MQTLSRRADGAGRATKQNADDRVGGAESKFGLSYLCSSRREQAGLLWNQRQEDPIS